jgi:hypothetical protein
MTLGAIDRRADYGAAGMDRHSLLWRRPGRRNAERRSFAALMRKVEARRRKLGMSKRELAAKLGTTDVQLLVPLPADLFHLKVSP